VIDRGSEAWRDAARRYFRERISRTLPVDAVPFEEWPERCLASVDELLRAEMLSG
jgi:hypothetical protein